MSRTESTMVDLGTVAPAFELVDVLSGKTVSRDSLFTDTDGKKKLGLLVMFVCPHCPYVKHLEAEIGQIGRDYAGAVAMAAVMSNDTAEYPQDGPEFMRAQAAEFGWPFPYLLDETQEVARAYEAACTPDFFLFDAELKLAYRGQMDSTRPKRGDFGNGLEANGEDLRAALDAVIAGGQPDERQVQSIGCNIKWREA